MQVRFTDAACEAHTREGIVKAKPGDAIITGTGGEQWRVSRTRAERRPMALHQIIQRLLLAAPAAPNAPPALQPLIDAVEEPHRVFDARALVYGHRYRSGFWAIYLLSAVAVLCAMLPLALGWATGVTGRDSGCTRARPPS